MRDDLEGSWPEIKQGSRVQGRGQRENYSRAKTAKKRTRRSQKAKWRTSRMTMTEKDLEEDGNKDQRMSKIKGRGIK